MQTQIVAVPVVDGRLSPHFGHSQVFAFHEVDPEAGEIVRTWEEAPPAHEPGLLPRWLGEQGVKTVLAGGMGRRAQGLFADQGISVVVGATAAGPDALVRSWLVGELSAGENLCDH